MSAGRLTSEQRAEFARYAMNKKGPSIQHVEEWWQGLLAEKRDRDVAVEALEAIAKHGDPWAVNRAKTALEGLR